MESSGIMYISEDSLSLAFFQFFISISLPVCFLSLSSACLPGKPSNCDYPVPAYLETVELRLSQCLPTWRPSNCDYPVPFYLETVEGPAAELEPARLLVEREVSADSQNIIWYCMIHNYKYILY